MDGGAAAPSDEAHDGVTWPGSAAAGQARKEIADPVHPDSTGPLRDGRNLRDGGFGLGKQSAQPSGKLLGMDLAEAHGGEEVIDPLVVEGGGDVVELDVDQAESLDLFFNEVASARNVLFACFASKP